MKKIGLIFLVLMGALACLGVAYGAWSETLDVSASVSAGDFGIEFVQAVSNDDNGLPDPDVKGNWTWNGSSGSAPVWNGSRTDSNNSSAAASLDESQNTLTLTVNGAYPGYWSSAACILKNTGTVPLKIDTVKVGAVSSNPSDSTPVSDRFTLEFSGALDQSLHTPIDPGDEALGTVYVNWLSIPSDQTTYSLEITVTATQWNMVD
jgi:hypothetical protein